MHAVPPVPHLSSGAFGAPPKTFLQAAWRPWWNILATFSRFSCSASATARQVAATIPALGGSGVAQGPWSCRGALTVGLGAGQFLVRSITCWTISRYINYIKGNEQALGQVLPSVLACVLDTNKRVQEAACSMLAMLQEKSGEDIVPWVEHLLQAYIAALGKFKVAALASSRPSPLFLPTSVCTAAEFAPALRLHRLLGGRHRLLHRCMCLAAPRVGEERQLAGPHALPHGYHGGSGRTMCRTY